MKKLISVFVLVFCLFPAFSQDSVKYKLADYYQQKTSDWFDAKNYDSSCAYANLHIDLESSFQSPRPDKMVLAYINLAFCEFRKGEYKQAIEVYNNALKWVQTSESEEFAKSFFGFMDLCYQRLEGQDEVFFEFNDKDYRKSFVFRINEVLWRKGTTFRVKINAGFNDGLIMGAVAFPISAPITDSLPQRLFQLGKGEIVEIGPWSAEAEVTIYDAADTFNWVQEGDMIETRILSKFKDESIIYKLLSSDITLLNNDRERMINPRYVLHYDSKEFLSLLLLVMAGQVKETEEFTREGDIFLTPAPIGQNQGKTINELFFEPDTSDITDFLEFIKAFPRKYMGKDFKANETYATWLLNNSPTTPGEILDSLMNEDNPQRRREILVFNKEVLDGTFYETWTAAADEYADKGLYDEAKKANFLVLEVANLLEDKKIKAHGYYHLAEMYKKQNKYDISIDYYDTAGRMYRYMGDSVECARCIYNIANVFSDVDNYKKGLKYYKKSKKLLLNTIGKNGTYEQWELVAYILWNNGYMVSQMGDQEAALQAYKEAGKILDSIGGSKTDRATLTRNVAAVSKKKGLYNDALEKYKESGQLFYEAGKTDRYAEAFDDIADVYFSMGQYRDAITNYTKAYEIKLTLDDKSGAGFSKANIGQAMWNLGLYDSAILFHADAVQLRREGNDMAGVAYSYEKIGDLWKENGNFDSALYYFQTAEAYYISNNDTTEKLAKIKKAVGALYSKAKNYQQALYYYKRSLDIYKTMGNPLGIAEAYYDIGVTHYNTKSYAEASTYLLSALSAYEGMKDKENAMYTHIYLSFIDWQGNNEFAKAEKRMRTALQLAKETGSTYNQGYAWHNIGLLITDQGKFDGGKKYYDSALWAYRSIGDQAAGGGVKNSIARYYINKGMFPQSRQMLWEMIDTGLHIKNFEMASDGYIELGHLYNQLCEYDSAKLVANAGLELNFKEVNNKYIEAGAYIHLGNTFNDLADYKTAVKYYKKADSIYVAEKSPFSRGAPINNIGTIYFFQGDYQNALAQFYINYNEFEKINYKGDWYINALLSIGEVYLEDKVWPEAEKWIKRGIAESKNVQLQRGIGMGNLLLGRLRLNQGKTKEAKNYLFSALKYYSSIGETERVIEANRFIGKAYYKLEKYDSANVYLNASIALCEETGNTKQEWEPLYYSGLIYIANKDTTNAIAQLKRGVDVLENIKGKIAGGSSNLVSFAKAQDKFKLYETLVEILLQKNDISMAFLYQEKSNISGLADQTRGGDNGPTRTNELLAGTTEETIAKELELKIDGFYAELIKEKSKPKAQQSAEKIAALNQLLDVNEKNFNKFVDSAINVSGQGQANLSNTIDPAKLEEARFDMGEEDLVIEYLAMENQLVIFVAGPTSLNARKVSINKTDLTELVMEFSKQLHSYKSDEKIVASNNDKLYKIFIEPIEDLLVGKKRLAFVPTGVIYSLPIQGLGKLVNGKMDYLISHYHITYINDTRFLLTALVPATINLQKMLVFGNADNTLVNAEKEAKEIQGMFPTATMFLRDSATEDKAKTMFIKYPIIHIASHGRFDKQNFENSYLVLAPNLTAGEDGRLTITEIREIKTLRNIDLLVLSACSQAVPNKTEGYVSSPAYLFITKGVKCVVATQWEVHDKATSVLMNQFYKNLDTGMPPSEALASAQNTMAQGTEFAHPYYWGAFEIVGKW